MEPACFVGLMCAIILSLCSIFLFSFFFVGCLPLFVVFFACCCPMNCFEGFSFFLVGFFFFFVSHSLAEYFPFLVCFVLKILIFDPHPFSPTRSLGEKGEKDTFKCYIFPPFPFQSKWRCPWNDSKKTGGKEWWWDFKKACVCEWVSIHFALSPSLR